MGRLNDSSRFFEVEKSSGLVSFSVLLNGVTGLNSGIAGAGLTAGFTLAGCGGASGSLGSGGRAVDWVMGLGSVGSVLGIVIRSVVCKCSGRESCGAAEGSRRFSIKGDWSFGGF